jgi:hypothetical protein
LRAVNPVVRRRVVIGDADVDLGDLAPDTHVWASGRVSWKAGETPQGSDTPLGIRFEESQATLLRIAEFDGESFIVRGLSRGLWSVSANLPSGGGYVVSVTRGGRDVIRDGLEVGSGPVSPVEILLAADGARIEGVARRRDGGELVPDARIVLIPPPQRRGTTTRFITIESDARGAFSVEVVPPGEYRLLALDVAGRSDVYPYWESPEFLRQYELRGELITVDPGARLTINPEAIPLVD